MEEEESEKEYREEKKRRKKKKTFIQSPTQVPIDIILKSARCQRCGATLEFDLDELYFQLGLSELL
jgi:hypothetical protein